MDSIIDARRLGGREGLRQAATLVGAVTEPFPGAVEEALHDAPKSAVRHARRATEALERHLPSSSEAAWEALEVRCALQR